MPITEFNVAPAVHTLPVINLWTAASQGKADSTRLATDRDGNLWERNGDDSWTCTHCITGNALGQNRTPAQVRLR
jgi:hypothetical protein